MNLNQYTTVRYVDRGRTLEEGCDCWGFARLLLMNEFGWPELPEFGWVWPRDQPQKNDAESSISWMFDQIVSPGPGVMACVFDADDNFRHVGVVVDADGVLSVMHIATARGVQVPSIREFENENRLTCCRVEYKSLRNDSGI